MTLSFYLYHSVVQLEKTKDLCLAIGQVKGLCPSNSITAFMVYVAEGPYRHWWTLSTNAVVHGKEPLL